MLGCKKRFGGNHRSTASAGPGRAKAAPLSKVNPAAVYKEGARNRKPCATSMVRGLAVLLSCASR